MWEYTFASLQRQTLCTLILKSFFFRFTFSNRPRPKVQRRRRKRLYLVQSAYILTCCRLQSRSARVALLCVAPATAAMHSVKVQRFGFPEHPSTTPHNTPLKVFLSCVLLMSCSDVHLMPVPYRGEVSDEHVFVPDWKYSSIKMRTFLKHSNKKSWQKKTVIEPTTIRLQGEQRHHSPASVVMVLLILWYIFLWNYQ